MAEPGNGARHFEVHCSSVMVDAIRRVHRRALAQGHGAKVTRAFAKIIRRLQVDPSHTGEPAYRLPGLRMQIRSVIVRPLVIDFAVCEDRPLVFIKGVTLLDLT